MAKQQNNNLENSSSATTNAFSKGMNMDLDTSISPEGSWSYARNLVNNSNLGDLGVVGNEPANEFCTQAPYTIIGSIPIIQDYFIVYSTDDANSEIGLFHQPSCTYTTIVNDPCLNFNRENLIIGDSKYKFDCTYDLYWDDGLNPSRKLNIGNLEGPYPDVFNNEPWPGIPYICNFEPLNNNSDCYECVNELPLRLDCEKIRLNKRMSIPCVSVKRGLSGGQLLNGSYYAVIAYSENQQRVTDYFTPSNIQALFVHRNTASSLDIFISNLDTENFQEFQLVVVSTNNQQTVAKEIGYYSTRTSTISIDYIDQTLPAVPLNTIPLRTPAYEKTEAMYDVNGYLIRVAPTEKFDFNYQPLANQIKTEWVMVEQPFDYYEKGGNEVGYMRDEVYAFWIRWVYNDGKTSSSYHIPGRPANDWEQDLYGSTDLDNIERLLDPNYDTRVWEVVNTAYSLNPYTSLPADGDPVNPGQVILSGYMGYWESSELYPADKPQVWNASSHSWSQTDSFPYPGTDADDYDLCNQRIRHHKMPADFIYATNNGYTNANTQYNTSHVRATSTNLVGSAAQGSAKAIRILGVRFGNIKAPVDNNGDIIPGVVGYEILRGSRQGNKSIIAKGLVANMRSYREEQSTGSPLGEEILYQNYLGNYLGSDPTLSSLSDETGNQGDALLSTYKNDYLTFHSPDTNFEYPFLSATELKLYGQIGSYNNMEGRFEPVPGHPKEKLITDIAFRISTFVGLGLAAASLVGKRIQTFKGPVGFNAGISSTGDPIITSGPANGIPTSNNGAAILYNATAQSLLNTVLIGALPTNTDGAIAALYSNIGPYSAVNLQIGTASSTAGNNGGSTVGYDNTVEWSSWRNTPGYAKGQGGLITFGYFWGQGTDATLDLIKAIIPYRDYVYRTICHLILHKMAVGNALISQFGSGNTRRHIQEIGYLEDQFTNIGGTRVNNLYRSRCVAVQLGRESNGTIIPHPIFTQGAFAPTVIDSSIRTIQSVTAIPNNPQNFGITFKNPTSGKFFSTASAMYGGLKVRYRNQYGQINSTNQITTGCHFYFKGEPNVPITEELLEQLDPGNGQVIVRQSPSVFGGDTYVGRYTEKNTFFYFYDWLYDVPDGTEIDYRLKYMINYPRYWADFSKYSTDTFIQQFAENTATSIGDIFSNDDDSPSFSQAIANARPSRQYNLEGPVNFFQDQNVYENVLKKLRLGVVNAYMYLFQSGVRDFFVESEYNIDHRDYGEQDVEKIFDPYGFNDLRALFDTSIIKFGNYYKYDISLGVTRTFNNYISWGSTQSGTYDPEVSETCFTYYPFRVIYSLQSNFEDKKDYWQIFLVNNYYDFDSKVTAFKSINRNGAIILQEKASPLMFNAVDTLETGAGTKITIGDGGLFSQPLQSLSNADIEFQHGSCQDRLSVINTPAGVYWMSALQGKIFTIAEGLQPISDLGMKWWFSKYLHYFLLDQFPDFGLVGNPVVGIGCQSVFDNENQILYFSKTDYKIKDQFLPYTQLVKGDQFAVNGLLVQLGDPIYFDNLSWTVSFDPKLKAWLSFHDWHPELTISNIKGFLTTKTDSGIGKIWRHYNNTKKFCNFYGKDYPFIIEYTSSTGQSVTTTRSIEYLLECYVYDQDGIDRYEVLDYNFDKAIVYNNEQVSGLLQLNLSPKNNAPVIVNYPQIDVATNLINILYSKEEQKYRFNQFWDVTRNRGEFQAGGILVQQPIWSTELNGYIRNLNVNNLDLNKSPFERKKFRHYANHVVLIRTVSDNVKMLLKVTNNKLLNSPR
jgi:hypothetical protein